MKKYLIITGDDFGFSTERNQGIIETIEKSATKSASLLLNCTGTNEAVEMSQRYNLCAGLHLNLTEGSPVSDKKYSTLTNTSGKFWGKFELRKLLETENIDPLEIKHEMRCQIEQFTRLVGNKPPYVDGHQHIHVHPGVSEIFASVLQEYNIRMTRSPVELSMKNKPWVNSNAMQFYTEVMENTENAKPIFDSHNVRYTDVFVGLSTMGANMTVARLKQSLLEGFEYAEKCSGEEKPFITCELMTHPGYATEKYAGGFDGQSDEFGSSRDREHEICILSSKQMLDFYEENDIHLVSHQTILQAFR